MVDYNKLPKTLDEQINLLKDRGLFIDNNKKTKKYLKNISYYHLSAYFKSFQKDNKFYKDTKFKDVIMLYEFDKKLRLLLLDVLERIEKSFKCSIVYNLSIEHNSSFWYLDESLYVNKNKFNRYVLPILENIKSSREVSIKHFYEKYNNEFPPSWIVFEVLSFGECVKLSKYLKRSEQNLFSKSFNLDKKFFLNWMHGLSMVRNICAHHARLWNKNIVLNINYKHKNYKSLFNSDKTSLMRLYNWLIVMKLMMEKINPTSDWINKLKLLIEEYNIPTKNMGFPRDWQEKL
jgi:abortive infection bacteriophage resistance protein